MDFKKTTTELLEPDRKLAVIVGESPRTRNELIRELWDYINERNLQDTDRRMINADKDLQEVLGGKKQVNVFQVVTLITKHLKKPSKTTARKSTAKKAALKKTAAKKSTTKKSAPKKTAQKKATAKKTTTKKTPAKKTTIKKSAPKKNTAKKAGKKNSSKKTK